MSEPERLIQTGKQALPAPRSIICVLASVALIGLAVIALT
jgi:hypothetical protein